MKNPEKKIGENILAETIRLIGFMTVMRVKRGYFALSIFLSVWAVFFQVLNIRLLMALLRGMIAHDYAFVKKIPVFKQIIVSSPKNFSAPGSSFFLLIAAIFIFTLLKNILQYAAELGVSYQVKRASNSLRTLIFSRYLNFGKLFYDRANLGRLSTVLIRFSLAVSAQLNSLQKLVSQFLSLIAYFGIMFCISWKLTLLTLCIFPFFVLLTQWVVANFKSISRAHVKSEEHLDDKIFSVLSAMPLVKAHNTEEEEKRLFNALNAEESELSFRLDKKEKLVQPIQELGMMVAFLILASAVTFLLPTDSKHISSYLIFFYLVRLSLPGFNAISQYRITLSRSSVRIERILEILKDEKKFILSDGAQEFQGLERMVEFRHLDFSYDGQKQILKDISLDFEKEKMTAIVGPTGAGKTTLVHLLLRFYDCPPGTIFLDGKDIRDFALKSLMGHLAYVSQDAFFFNDTIRMNMTYGLGVPATDDELISAAKKARLFDLIMSLPERFDTKIGERGIQLSGGEKQRLSIARALLRRSEILILDEATSSLDAKTEKLIQEAINEAVKGRTTIVIAHRFSTIKHADKIIVLENGRIAEEGDLTELLAKKGKFFEHWNEQKFF